MDRTERLYQIEGLIRQRGHASFAQLMDGLEVSRATLWRDLEYLRSRLGAPIVYDRELNAYRFEAPSGADRGTSHELPGLWFNERELYALLMAHQLLSELGSEGLLGRHLQPLRDRIQALLQPPRKTPPRQPDATRTAPGQPDAPDPLRGATDWSARVRIISVARRPVPIEHFERVAEALLHQRRLHLVYRTRGRAGERSEREVSPQRLVHHRNTWYLDAWCHRAEDLRRFALDAMEEARVLGSAAHELSLGQVQRQMDAGYGIYAGAAPKWARLRFTPQAAAWVSREQWHPQQQGRWRADGSWELRLPYTQPTELLMDVLRHGDDVEVMAPASLRTAVQERLRRSLARYAEAPEPGLARSAEGK